MRGVRSKVSASTMDNVLAIMMDDMSFSVMEHMQAFYPKLSLLLSDEPQMATDAEHLVRPMRTQFAPQAEDTCDVFALVCTLEAIVA